MAAPKIQPEKRAVLYFTSGASKGEALKLRRDATIFGREKGDIIVQDTEVSSTHCQIQNVGGMYHLFDMNSTNGTFVNDNRVLKTKLEDGDLITIGKTSFRFALEEDAKVRHISTIFKSALGKTGDQTPSIVDTLIEGEIRAPSKKLRLHIHISYTDGTSEEVEIPQQTVYIGRASTFGRFEHDQEISRKHLLIKVNNQGDIFVEDQGSTNGSFLNGKKIKGMNPVQPGDVVRVGSSLLKIKSKRG